MAILTDVSLFYLLRLENREVGDIRNGDQDLRTWVSQKFSSDSLEDRVTLLNQHTTPLQSINWLTTSVR
jgi:hypothetical protein